MMAESNSKKVLVLGAGIVGICNALALQEKGYQVTLIDKNEPSDATSFGNAGVISQWACIPQSMPGLWKNVPKWLLDPNGPLSIRWSYFPRMMPWLIEFLKAGNINRIPAIADAMFNLNRPNLDIYRELLKGTGEENLIKDCSYLYVSRKELGINLNGLEWKLRKERGVPFEQITGDAAREIEPDLSSDIKSAVLIKNQGRTLNPGRLGKVLAAKAFSLGVCFTKAEVKKIIPLDGGGYDVSTDKQKHTADTVVLTAGVWSAKLLEALGVHVPLEAERGYHLLFKDPGISLTHSVLDTDNKFVSSSMEMGLRSAGTAEFAGIDAPPDYRRAYIFKGHAKSLFPKLNMDTIDEWMGRRPSSPDSVPYIGEVTGYPRLFYGFGHGHLGLTGAPMTGRMITALVANEPLNIDMSPYRLDRFNK
jgi:D-amino-acid dehydrogenase